MSIGSKATMTRRMGKREQTMTTELTEWNPPRSYAFRGIDGPIRAIGRGTLEPVGDGQRTQFTFEIDFEGHGIGKFAGTARRAQAGADGDDEEPRGSEGAARERRRLTDAAVTAVRRQGSYSRKP